MCDKNRYTQLLVCATCYYCIISCEETFATVFQPLFIRRGEGESEGKGKGKGKCKGWG